jgi:hypothetical protein
MQARLVTEVEQSVAQLRDASPDKAAPEETKPSERAERIVASK